MLELKKIKKSYFVGGVEQEVLKGIDINFRKAEFTSILGASGSGKTTLLNIIGGLDHYDSGDLIIEGISTKDYFARDWDAYRNYRVGFIFQNYNLIGHQSVLSNVELALTLSGISKQERKQKALDALKKVGLEEHVNKRPNQLSGGQMQRVAIARAIVNDPEIILADEPTGALDSKTSIQIMDLLKEISKDKLIIMVTHNAEIAKEYSSRIIELKDGKIINDSNPYKNPKKEESNKNVHRKAMSLLTSLSLSFNNLMTKKGRTFLTSFAGSIGIIGIALILSLSNGVKGYINDLERDSLSDFPLIVEKKSFDFMSLFSFESEKDEPCDEKSLCSKDDIVKQLNFFNEKVIKTNNLEEFKKYLDESETIKKNTNEVKYEYDLDLQIYSTMHGNNVKVNPNEFNALSSIGLDDGESESVGGYVSASISNDKTPVFTELLDNEEVLNSKYKIIEGRLPQEYNEVVIIVGKDNIIKDSYLYAMDIKDRRELKDSIISDKDKDKEKERETYTFEDFLNLSYKLVLNTDYYKKEGNSYIDYSNNPEFMERVINNGIDLKVVGVIKNEDLTDNSSLIGYKHSLVEYVINSVAKTDIYKAQIANKKINVLTNEPFDDVSTSYEKNARALGIAELNIPSKISIYPKDFDSKERVIKEIDEYNKKVEEAGNKELQIEYQDSLKLLVGALSSVVTIISFVLIGVVAISLIVSSIMISIITYISVLERTKEIGILRAIGASKKDVKRVFNAETIIEGFIAGVMGIVITFILNLLINLVIGALAHINNIAVLPIGSSLFLIFLSTVLTVIAGIKPAGMASRKDPVEALRTE